MSYVQLTYHLVLPTHARKPTIVEEHEKELYAYFTAAAHNMGGMVRAIGGKPDHVHILLDLPATLSIADCIRKLKQGSSVKLRANNHFPYWEGWSTGYAIFSCSPRPLDRVIAYVRGQKEHHHKATLEEEMKALFDYLGVVYDPKFLR